MAFFFLLCEWDFDNDFYSIASEDGRDIEIYAVKSVFSFEVGYGMEDSFLGEHRDVPNASKTD